MNVVKFTAFLMSLLTLQACSDRFLSEGVKAKDNNHYFADATECYQTAQRKEKVNVMMSGNTQHSFAFPITIDIPITYDAGAYKNCMIYAGHKEPKIDADPTAYLEISRRCLDQAKGEDNANEAYANCVKNGDLTVDVIHSKKGVLKQK